MRMYDNVGRQISNEDYSQWDKERHVASTNVGHYWISTVFLVFDHSYKEGPLGAEGVERTLFETMVFDNRNKKLSELDVERYATAQEAREGHEQMVMKYNRPWRKIVDLI